MTAPTPASFNKAVDAAMRELLRRVPTLKAQYRLTHDAAHSQTVAEREHVQTGMSSPTESVVLSKRKLRETLEAASKVIGETGNDWRDVQRAMGSALERAYPVRDDFDRRAPRTATRADIAEAREAQVRRHERGEAT